MIKISPIGNMNVFTKCHGNLFNICFDISLIKVSTRRALRRNHTSAKDLTLPLASRSINFVLSQYVKKIPSLAMLKK